MTKHILAVLLLAATSSFASAAETKLQATIFSFDGKDFVRSETTLTADANPPRIRNSTRTARPTKPSLKSIRTPGPRSYLVEISSPTTRHSPMI